MRSNKKAAIFDLDGVLVNSMPLHIKAWRSAFQEVAGISVTERDLYLLEGMRGAELIQKIFEIRIHLSYREWIAAEIQAFINNLQLEIFFISDFDQLRQATVKFIGRFPTYNETSNACRFCPLNMLPHHLRIVTGIMPQQRIILFCAIPRSSIKPNVIIGKNRNRV